MLVLDNFSQYDANTSAALVLAVGNFDGLHLGHQALLEKVITSARHHQGHAAVLTFSEHPQHILHPTSKPPLLTCQSHKLFLLEQAGVDICFIIPFTTDFSQMEPECFVEEVLVNVLKVKEVYLGFNARFGRERRGDASLMEKLAGQYDFHFESIRPVEMKGDMVSSSRLRHLIREGQLEEAADCLGRRFSIFGEVVEGDGRGKDLGFPTANLNVNSEILPPLGVYPVRVREVQLNQAVEANHPDVKNLKIQKGSWFDGVLNYGYRPTFDSKKAEAALEAFLFDFEGDLYGRTLEVTFFPRMRGEQHFEGVEALKAQIELDIKQAKQVLADLPKPNKMNN